VVPSAGTLAEKTIGKGGKGSEPTASGRKEAVPAEGEDPPDQVRCWLGGYWSFSNNQLTNNRSRRPRIHHQRLHQVDAEHDSHQPFVVDYWQER